MGRSAYLFAYEGPLLLLQVMVLFTILCQIKKQNGPLSSPFYKLYAFQALADLGSFASVSSDSESPVKNVGSNTSPFT